MSAAAMLASIASASPAGPRWVQQHFGPAEGLPVSSASSARIDPDGFLWVATHDGLARFDGERFDVHDSMRFPAMSGNRVQSIHADGQGRLFAHTAHGDWLGVRSGEIERAGLGVDAPTAVRHVDDASLCVTTALALHCPDGAGGFPQRVRFPPGAIPALALPGHDDDVWLTTVTGEVWRFRDGNWRSLWRLPGAIGPHLPRNAIIARDGNLWVSIDGRLLRVTADDHATFWQDADAPGLVLQLREDAAGRIWVGAHDGLYRIDDGEPRKVFSVARQGSYLSWRAPDESLWVRAGGLLYRFASDGDDPDPAAEPVLTSTGQLLDLLFGADGAVWVMTLHDGLHRLSRARVELLDESSALGGGNVYGVARDGDGTMWLGTLGGGLKGVDRQGGVHRLGEDEGLPGNNPWLVAPAPDGSLYVGTYAPGLWRRPPGGSRFEPVAMPDALFGEQVLAVAFDSTQALWLGTTAGAWRRDGDGWRRQWPTSGQRQRVNALIVSTPGIVWYGGSGGVWRQHADRVHPVAEAMLSNTSVRDLYLAGDGALWISTDGRGLLRVAADDPHGHAATRFGRAQGLPSNTPHAVREDANGNLWVNSNQGIFRLNQANILGLVGGRDVRMSPLTLGLADGLSELEGNGGVQPSADVDSQGRLWFPSQRGVVRFDPDAIPIRTQAPRAVIDAIESGGEVLGGDRGRALPVGVRTVTFRYGAADLHAGYGLRFRYRLLPIEQGWTDSSGGRMAAFSGLRPGRYRFELVAGNSDGIWADEPTAREFEVAHFWYESRPVRAAALSVLALLVAGVLRLRSYRLHQRTRELDRQVNQRTDELRREKLRVETTLSDLSQAHAQLAQTHVQIEDSNLRLAEQAQRLEALDRFRSRLLADVSHELRTPVMLVSMPLRELQGQASELSATQQGKLRMSVKQLDRLAGLVEQLVGLVQVESGQMPLRASRFDLAAFLRDIVAGYQPIAERAEVRLAFAGSGDPCPLFADAQHLTTVFGNLVDNAIKHGPGGSTVTVSLSCDDERAVVQVEDQGPGFDSDVARRLFERFFRAEGPPRQGREGLGIGLALARELVELHGGRISAASAPGAGATFRVELPLGSAHLALDDLALDRPPACDPMPSPTAMADRGDGRLLLVEDHPDLAGYLADRLGEHVPVTCVGSAEDALRVLANDAAIGLVVSDVMLPGASGIDLCRQLRDTAATAAVPVILISAKAAADDRQSGLAAGAVSYLAKPFGFEKLLTEIARAWPAVAPRLAAPSVDETGADPLLAVALAQLGDAGFTVLGWADRAHLSERQLRRRVKELTGQPPQTWLREQRLLRVRHLLRSGACKTLAEAGSRCGLDNPAWLYRCYRARFGEH